MLAASLLIQLTTWWVWFVFHRLLHDNIVIFKIEIIREFCTYQNGIFESSFSFVILECILLVCGCTVCVVVFAFLEFWLCIVLVAHIGMELLSQALFPIIECIQLVSGICLFWNFDYTLYWWVESVYDHYFTLQTLDDSIV